MHKHPYFDLELYDDDELCPFLPAPVVERTTLHEWPLSCVQRLTCETGATYIYKVQSAPTVEPTFYQRARSPLLAKVRVLPGDREPAALLLEDVRALPVSDLQADESTRLAMVHDVLARIAEIEGDLPALGDIRTPDLWLAYGQSIVQDLRALVGDGTFQQVTPAMIDQVSATVRSGAVLLAIDGPTDYVHLDLWGENVFMLDDGYRVIDWQRPIWGPVALDQATLLASVGIDPAQHISAGIFQLRTLLLIGWFAQAARRWFPPGAPTYDTQIAQLIDGE